MLLRLNIRGIMRKQYLLIFILFTIWGQVFSQHTTEESEYNYFVELYLYAEYGAKNSIPYSSTSDEIMPIVTNVFEHQTGSVTSDFNQVVGGSGAYNELWSIKDFYSAPDGYRDAYTHICGHLSFAGFLAKDLNATYKLYDFQIGTHGDMSDFCSSPGLNCYPVLGYNFASSYGGDSNIQFETQTYDSDDGNRYYLINGGLKIIPLYLLSLNERFNKEGDDLVFSLEYKEPIGTSTTTDNNVAFSHPAYDLDGMSFDEIDNYLVISSSFDNFSSSQLFDIPWGPGEKTIPYQSIVDAFDSESEVLGCELRIKVVQYLSSSTTFTTLPQSFYYFPSLSFSDINKTNPSCNGSSDGKFEATVNGLPTTTDGSITYMYNLIDNIDQRPLISGNVNSEDNQITLEGEITENLTLPAGEYRLEVYSLFDSDENIHYFPAVHVFELTQPSPLEIETFYAANDWNGYKVATGRSTAPIRVEVTGGTPAPNYLYVFNHSDYNPIDDYEDFEDLSPGLVTLNAPYTWRNSITITVFDDNNCPAGSETIDFKRADEIVITGVPDTISWPCNSGNTGTHYANFDFTVSGGVGRYYVYLDENFGDEDRLVEEPNTAANNFNSNYLNNLGSYLLEVYDISNQNTANRTPEGYQLIEFTVTEPPYLEVSNVLPQEVLCSDSMASAIVVPNSSDVSRYFVTDLSDNPIKNSTSSTIYGLNPATSYKYYFRDSNNCTSAAYTEFTATAPPELLINANTIEMSSCAGSEDAIVEIEPFGGTPYSGSAYNIEMEFPPNSDAATYTTLVFDSLKAGDAYRFRVTDANACWDTISYTPGIVSNLMHINSIDSTYAYCDERENGTITVTLDPGDRPASPYEFTIHDSENNLVEFTPDVSSSSYNFDNLPPGIYQIEVEDAADCKDQIGGTIIIDPNQILVDNDLVDSSRSVCEGVGTGTITVEAQGGYTSGSAYDYFLYNAADSLINTYIDEVDPAIFSSLLNGQYTVVAGDSALCYDTVLVNIGIEGQPVSIDQLIIEDQYCEELSGSIDVISSSTAAPIDTMVLTFTTGLPGALSNTGTGFMDGLPGNDDTEYLLTIIDEIGCQLDSAFIIEDLENDPQISMSIIDSVACSTASNGIIQINATQPIVIGDFAFNLEVDSGLAASTYVFDSLSIGDYNLYVEDPMGCGTDTSFIISAIAEGVNIADFNIIDASCVNAANAGIGLKASGSLPDSPGYYFVLNNSDTLYGDTVTFLDYPVGGNYTVVLYDQYGCSYPLSGIQFLPRTDSLNIALDSTTNASCPGNSNGKIQVQALNGNPFAQGYLYRILNQSDQSEVDAVYANENPELTGIPLGMYSVEVSDADNCLAMLEDISIGEPQTPEMIVNEGYVAQKGDSTGWADASISLGNGKYFIEWYNNATNNLVFEDTTTGVSSAIDLPAGVYMVRVQDTAGCIFWDDEWLEDTFTILEPQDSLRLELQQMVPVTCNGLSDGTFTLVASGGWGNSYRFGTDPGNIASSDPLFEGFTAGTDYLFYVQDTAGVLDSAVFSMTQPEVLEAAINTITDAACNGSANGEVLLDITGGNGAYSSSIDQITWISGNQLTGLTAGTYLLTVRDSLNCETTTSATVEEPTLMFVADSAITNTECKFNEGIISTTIQGGTPYYTYTWYNGDTLMIDTEPEIDSLYSGVYTLQVTDDHNCLQEFTFYVIDSTSLDVASLETFPVSCWEGSNGSASIEILDGFPPYTITWPGGTNGNSVVGLTSGNYQVEVLDAEGCRAFELFSIGTPDSLSVDITELIDPLCLGVADGEIDVVATGGTPNYDYEWSHGRSRSRAPNLDAGAYLLTVTDANNCTKDFSFNLDYLEQISSNLPQELMVCHGNIYPLKPGNFEFFTWYQDGDYISADSVLFVSDSGEYIVEFEDARGCQATDTVQIGVSDVALGAQFLMASIVEQGDTVVVFEASDPVPDSIELYLDESLEMLDGGQYFQYLVASETGQFEISLVSHLGDCQDIITKTLTVVPNDGIEDSFGVNVDQVIREVKLYPNPTNGNFAVEVDLNIETGVSLRLVSFNNGFTLDSKRIQGSDYYFEPFDMEGLETGVYLLSIEAGEEMQTLKVIVF